MDFKNKIGKSKSTDVNTIDRCFDDAQAILNASKNGAGQVAKTYAIFTDLQPVFSASQNDSRLALLALAIWRSRKGYTKFIDTHQRKGVNQMENEKNSLQVRAGSRTYFFDIKETKDKKPYLIITESRFKGVGKEHERTSLLIFQDHITEFSKTLSNLANKMAVGNDG